MSSVKIWLIILLLVPAFTLADAPIQDGQPEETEGWHAATPMETSANPVEPDITWVDSSHAYATDQAQALTEWMDNFFGDPNYDLEKAESLLRLEWATEWDEEDDDYNNKVRLRGKLQLPRVSKRLNLVFSGEDGDDLTEDERQNEDRVGLLYNVQENKRSRVDITMGISTSELRPGIRYRNQGPISERNRYRFTQRVQYESDEGFYTTGQLNLDRALSEDKLLRWSNRVVYGEETDGAEWRSKVSMRHRLKNPRKKHNLVVSYYGSVNGVTDPSFTKNYRLGVLFRRQVYRQFLFMEFEPSYNFRKKRQEDSRNSLWNVVVRFEIALERDLRRVKKSRKADD